MQIKIKNINKSFRSTDGERKIIFNDFSFGISDPDFITIIGPNGCGKSTLLNMIAQIEKPDSGSIELNSAGDSRNGIGYVWQDFRSSLLPWLNVYKNIEFPLKLRNVPNADRKKIVDNLLDEFRISFSPTKEVYKLSGGQQQLVCLLRSIASNPELLLCDEPFSALDQSSRWTMAFYLEQLWLKKKIPVILVSHDIDESILLGNKIILLNKSSQVEDILENPLPRPRSIETLSSPEHIRLRQRVIDFMKVNGAIQDSISSRHS
ncbi:MAG: transporter related [Bacteroidetes bacterium]|nr:transporter related [Bacteroidota bacterium]